jgi:hypothetical protein
MISMPCPYYRAGACHSPKLGEPSDSVVAAHRCGGAPEIYRACSLYVEAVTNIDKSIDKSSNAVNNGRGGFRVITKNSIASRVYGPIHIIREHLQSECPQYRIEAVGGGYVAICNVLKRPLTKYEARLCTLYWRDCPYVNIAKVSS